MARLGRLFVPGYPQLVLQRGNNGAALFLDEEDYRQFLHILRESAREASLAMSIAYVLMPDHVHLLLSAPTAEAVGGAVQRLGRGYVRWFNDKHHRSGTLWEGRYRSTAVEPRQYSCSGPAIGTLSQIPFGVGSHRMVRLIRGPVGVITWGWRPTL